jgi:broad specificity phosphatase PhoE
MIGYREENDTLSSLGKEQAQHLSERLQVYISSRIYRVWVSEARRTLQTAVESGILHGSREFGIIPALNEIDMGSLTGLPILQYKLFIRSILG